MKALAGFPVRVAVAVACVASVVVGTGGSAVAAKVPDDYLYRLDAVTSTAPVAAQNFESRVSYTTAGGSTRTVKVAVRTPPGAAEQPLPVVIVVHGGGEQPNDRNPSTTLPEWSEALARAGYLAINVLHGTNEGASRIALCQAIGFPVIADPSALAATLQEIATAVVGAAPSGGGVSVNVAQLIATHPGLFEHLQDIVDEAADESPLVSQVIDILMARLLGCGQINALGLWDRPYDVAAVVDALHDGEFPELEGWMDLTKVAVLGHSNGTSSVLNAVGMQRTLPNGVKVPAPFPAGHPRRPTAAVALSPMGINTYGHFDTAAWFPGSTDSKEHSWMGLEQIPVMTITGDGDNHCKSRYVCSDSDSGSKRRIPFQRMPAGDKYLMYVADRFSTEIVSSHETFGSLDGPGTCRSASLATECANTVKWIKSTTIAFLDAQLLGELSARRWLRSRKLVKASAGVAGIQRK
ncbi:MAG: hypothetical protein ABR587_12190 [Candidatus Binatia bacterium]